MKTIKKQTAELDFEALDQKVRKNLERLRLVPQALILKCNFCQIYGANRLNCVEVLQNCFLTSFSCWWNISKEEKSASICKLQMQTSAPSPW